MNTQNPDDKSSADRMVDEAQALRRQAEERSGTMEKLDPEALSTEETRLLLHELRVHQIELEMQNEELRRGQQELEASQSRYRDLYDFAPVGYCTLSEKGLILEANLTAASLLGVNRGAVIQQPITRFILADDQDIYYRHRKQLFETGAPQVCEMRMLRRDSAPFWARVEGSAARHTDGAPVCRCVISDIADQKRAEEEREKLQDQLLQARKMETVGRLAGGVAHDFNNMLSIILLSGENLLGEFREGDTLREDVQQILNAGRRSAALTRQLLAYARKQMINPRVLDLNDTVEEMLSMLRRLIGENIDLVWLPGRDLWAVKMDPTQIDQILVNLLVNARDAIADVGKATIRTGNITIDGAYCAGNAEASPGEYVILTVSDNGCGMEQEVLDKLFEPFFTTKEVGQGTGMGLPTVYGIVKQNNGFITVQSEPGKGAAIAVYLPRVRSEAEARRVVDTGEIPRGQGETVLLVEDEAGLLKLARMILERLGYTVLTAGTPRKALDLAREHGEIDLLMTDVMMPEMNGRELARRLRETRPSLRCLFMSGYTADIIANRGKLEEGVHFIQKPFSLRELAVKVRKVMDH